MSGKSEKEKIIRIIKELAAVTDLAAYMNYVGRRTAYGRQPGPSPWHFTAEFLEKYGESESLDGIVTRFMEAGATSETQAALLVAQHIRHVPKQR